MATSGGQPGNDNAAKGAEWRNAIKRALAHKASATYREGLDQVAGKLVDAAIDQGDQWAIREIGERIDGKAAQPITGPDDGPLKMVVDVRLIKADQG